MATDILQLFPDLAAIGQSQLQAYCSEWGQRPIAKQFGVTQITVDAALMLHIYLAAESAVPVSGQALLPIDELLGYIVDRHFQDPVKRKELHATIREARSRWGEIGGEHAASVEGVGRLWLKCKNQACRAEIETHHFASPGQEIICPTTKVTCPGCGGSYEYEGCDLYVRVGTTSR